MVSHIAYHSGEDGYSWLSMPYCTRSIGGAIPPASCVGGAGVPYVGNVWAQSDPNNANDLDACTTLTIQSVCADGESLCATAAACTACGADGSWAVVSTADPLNKQEYLELENLDAWLEVCLSVCLSLSLCLSVPLCLSLPLPHTRAHTQDMGGCDGASTPSGTIDVGEIHNGTDSLCLCLCLCLCPCPCR